MSAKLKTSFVHGPKISLFYHELLVVVLEASPGILLVGEALDGDHGPPVPKVARWHNLINPSLHWIVPGWRRRGHLSH